jgi:hypothetical protein
MSSLDFLKENPSPFFKINQFSLPIVVGSGNAFNAGQVIFSGRAAIFADESNFRQVVTSYNNLISKGMVSDAVIISASGEKDSVWETEYAKKLRLKTTLMTCKPNSSAAKIADRIISYKSIAEPYTYNTSTYLGMILSTTGEKASDIKKYIEKLEIPGGFNNYESYAFVMPDKYLNVAPMIIIKDNELFGPHLMIRAYTEGHARHAKFVHPWEKELVISIGFDNKFFGHPDHRLKIEFPKDGSFGMMLSLTYYLCGLIQNAKPDYFKKNIGKYCTDFGPKAYGKDNSFDVIVPANK